MKKYKARFLPTNRIYWIQILPPEFHNDPLIVLNHNGTRQMTFKDEIEFFKFWKIHPSKNKSWRVDKNEEK